MWTFDNFPIDKANRELGTNIDQAWLDRVRLASVRLGGEGGAGEQDERGGEETQHDLLRWGRRAGYIPEPPLTTRFRGGSFESA